MESALGVGREEEGRGYRRGGSRLQRPPSLRESDRVFFFSQETEAKSLLNSRSRLCFPATRSLYFWMLQRAEHELHPAFPPLCQTPPPPCPPVMSLQISLTRATNTEWDARSAPDCAPDRAEDTAVGWRGRGREGWRGGREGRAHPLGPMISRNQWRSALWPHSPSV